MSMKTNIKPNLDALKLSDIYSLMLFILYKIKDIPEYAVLSELCYLLDSSGLHRLLAYFAGRTITIPTEEEFVLLTNALLVYQYVNIENRTLSEAFSKLECVTQKQKDEVTDLYLKIIPIMQQYNVDRKQINTHGN